MAVTGTCREVCLVSHGSPEQGKCPSFLILLSRTIFSLVSGSIGRLDASEQVGVWGIGYYRGHASYVSSSDHL